MKYKDVMLSCSDPRWNSERILVALLALTWVFFAGWFYHLSFFKTLLPPASPTSTFTSHSNQPFATIQQAYPRIHNILRNKSIMTRSSQDPGHHDNTPNNNKISFTVAVTAVAPLHECMQAHLSKMAEHFRRAIIPVDFWIIYDMRPLCHHPQQNTSSDILPDLCTTNLQAVIQALDPAMKSLLSKSPNIQFHPWVQQDFIWSSASTSFEGPQSRGSKLAQLRWFLTQSYSYVWFIESDVHVPGYNWMSILEKYDENHADIIARITNPALHTWMWWNSCPQCKKVPRNYRQKVLWVLIRLSRRFARELYYGLTHQDQNQNHISYTSHAYTYTETDNQAHIDIEPSSHSFSKSNSKANSKSNSSFDSGSAPSHDLYEGHHEAITGVACNRIRWCTMSHLRKEDMAMFYAGGWGHFADCCKFGLSTKQSIILKQYNVDLLNPIQGKLYHPIKCWL